MLAHFSVIDVLALNNYQVGEESYNEGLAKGQEYTKSIREANTGNGPEVRDRVSGEGLGTPGGDIQPASKTGEATHGGEGKGSQETPVGPPEVLKDYPELRGRFSCKDF